MFPSSPLRLHPSLPLGSMTARGGGAFRYLPTEQLTGRDGQEVTWNRSELRRLRTLLSNDSANLDDIHSTSITIALACFLGEPLVEYTWWQMELFLIEIKRYPELSSLTDHVVAEMADRIDERNCVSLWLRFPHSAQRHEMERFVLYHFVGGALRDSLDTAWLRLSPQQLTRILSHHKLNSDENDVIRVVDKWISLDEPARKQYMSELYKAVRRPGVKWSELNPAQVSLATFAGVDLPVRRVRDQLVVLGGWTEGAPMSNVDFYDQTTRQWSRAGAMELKYNASYHGTAVVDGSLYLIGGYNLAGHHCTVCMWDGRKKEFVERGPMHEKRCYISNSCVVLDGMIYAIGGFDGKQRLKTAERYDPKTNQWTMVAPMGNIRSDTAAQAAGGKIYVVGGFNGSEILDDVEVYCPDSDMWMSIATMPGPRSGHSVLFDGSSLLVVGGFDGSNRLSSVLAWRPGSFKWRKDMPDMATPRSNFTAVMHNGTAYVLGGYDGTRTTNKCERLLPGAPAWDRLGDMTEPKSALSSVFMVDWVDEADAMLG